VKPPTQRSEEFLRLYRRYGSGLSLGQFCRRQGFDRHSVDTWLAGVEGFKEAYDAVLAELSGSPTTTSTGLMKFGLSEDQAAFLSHYRESHERGTALALVGWTVSDLQNALKNPIFGDELDMIRKELQLLVEDSLSRKALEGSLGHQKLFLEAVDPEQYARKITHKVSGSVKMLPQAAMENRKQFWAQRLAGVLPSATATKAEDADVVDAEFVGVGGEPN
jgi:hypothetical protein